MTTPWFGWPIHNPSIFNTYFETHYYPGYCEDAQQILNLAKCARETVIKYLDIEFENRVKIYIYNEPKTYRGFHLNHSDMKYDHYGYYISMISPTVSSGFDPQYDDLWYKSNLIHEYVHAVTLEYVKKNGKNLNCFMPKWFKEGIAEYVKLYHSSKEILTYYQTYIEDKIKSIKNIEVEFNELSNKELPNNRDNQIGWAILIKYLVESSSKECVLDIFNSEKQCLTEALEEKLGENYKEKWSSWSLFSLDPLLESPGGLT